MSMDRQARAYLFAASAVLLWSTVATAFKISLRYLDVAQLLFLSSSTATLVLLMILLLQGNFSVLFDLTLGDCLRLALFGLLNPFAYYFVLFAAYDLLPAQIAQSLNYSWAIALMLLSIPILKHRVSRSDLLAALICYAGVVVISFSGGLFPDGAFSIAGIALALGSTVIWALYWVFKARERIDPVAGLFVSFLCSLPLIGLVCLYFSGLQGLPLQGVLGAVWVGVFEMGVTYTLWLWALQLSRSTANVSTLIFCSPFLSLIFIYYILGETIMPSTVIGLLLIVAGLTVQHRGGRDSRARLTRTGETRP